MPSYNEASRKVPPKAEDLRITNTAGEKVGQGIFAKMLFTKSIKNLPNFFLNPIDNVGG
jgi:hypothetical protein